MKLLLLLTLAFSFIAPAALADPPQPQIEQQQLPPPLPPPQPQQEAQPQQGPQLVPPQQQPQQQNAQQAAAPQPAKKPGKPPEFFKARRAALAARKQAQRDRMRQFKAARAEAEQKAYEDWHERYLADTPVRVEYYRALSNAYEAEAVIAQQRAAYYYTWGPPIYVPIIPVYTPIYDSPFYGTVVYWGW